MKNSFIFLLAGTFAASFLATPIRTGTVQIQLEDGQVIELINDKDHDKCNLEERSMLTEIISDQGKIIWHKWPKEVFTQLPSG
jgi:hypothetical protein